MQRHPRGAHDVLIASHWQPGRLLIGWSLGVLTTLGLLTASGGWYEYRELATAPASGSPGRRTASLDPACQADRDAAINLGGWEVVPSQPDDCYLRRPRVRPWQWADGLREGLGLLEPRARDERRIDETVETQIVHANVNGWGVTSKAPALASPAAGIVATWYDAGGVACHDCYVTKDGHGR
jgi:hypothetical protein